MIKKPKVIFIVGSAASGKSTLAKYIKDAYDNYHLVSDLQELKKLLKSEELNKNYQYIKPLPSGGFDIVEPLVWDKVLSSTVNKMRPNQFYICEFARGIDQKYINTLRINEKEIYNRSFEIILETRPDIKLKDILIIHVKCLFNIRFHRNIKRQDDKKHYVAKTVMETVYRKDNFQFMKVGPKYGYLNNKNRILVYDVMNSKNLSTKEMQIYFSVEIEKAFNIYSKYGDK